MIGTPPPPSAPRPVHFPTAVARTLDNGLHVIALEQRHVPLIGAQLLLPAGGAYDPRGCAGLAALTSALLTQGANGMSATGIADALDALGARLSASASYDVATVAVSATTPNFRRRSRCSPASFATRRSRPKNSSASAPKRSPICGWSTAIRARSRGWSHRAPSSATNRTRIRCPAPPARSRR